MLYIETIFKYTRDFNYYSAILLQLFTYRNSVNIFSCMQWARTYQFIFPKDNRHI